MHYEAGTTCHVMMAVISRLPLPHAQACTYVHMYTRTYIHTYIHSHSHRQYNAVYWSYRTSRTDRWFLPCLIPWVRGLPEVAHGTTEDPEEQGYRATRLWGQWQLQSVSISNGNERWPVGSPGVVGQGITSQQRSNKQQARAHPMGAMQQPRNKHVCMRQSEIGPRPGVSP